MTLIKRQIRFSHMIRFLTTEKRHNKRHSQLFVVDSCNKLYGRRSVNFRSKNEDLFTITGVKSSNQLLSDGFRDFSSSSCSFSLSKRGKNKEALNGKVFF